MTRQLLEAAAKAAGYKIAWEGGCETGWMAGGSWWNPLTDDGDCFRMETELRLDGPHWTSSSVWYYPAGGARSFWEDFTDHPDANAARRMAALRAAASLPPKETK